MLNLNVPDAPRVDVLGLRWAGLAPVGGVRTVITGRDDHGLDLDLVPNDRPVPEGTDSALLRAGWATVTPSYRPAPPTCSFPWWSGLHPGWMVGQRADRPAARSLRPVAADLPGTDPPMGPTRPTGAP